MEKKSVKMLKKEENQVTAITAGITATAVVDGITIITVTERKEGT